MSMKDQMIGIGFDKCGEAEFSISAGICSLSFEEMQALRAMIPVAIGQTEAMWARYQEQKNPDHQAKSVGP